jgi:hypothetical protein
MSNFDIYKWNRERHLIDSRLNESKADLAAKAIDQAIAGVDESLGYSDFAKAVATILKDEYGAHNFNPFMEVLHAELGINEEISDYEMVVYKVEGITANPDEGGPDEPFEMEIKLDASLSADEVKDAIRDAARREQGRLYKLDYKKA